LTVQFTVGVADPDRGNEPPPRSLSFCVSRALDDQLTVSILAQEIEPTEHGLSSVKNQELLVLDRAPEPGKAPLFLIWKARIAKLKAHNVAVYFEVSPTAGRGLARKLSECRESLAHHGKEADARGSAVSKGEAQEIDLANVLESLSMMPKRRAMLVNQAQKSGAHLALDLGLAGDANLLATYFLRVIPLLEERKAEERKEEKLTPEKLGWILEREAWIHVLLQLEAEPQKPEVLALAVRHAGELARYPGMMNALLEESSGLAAFKAGILLENRSILISNMPGPRIRAFLWLEDHGQDLEGYQPMATQKERRVAYLSLVRKWESQASKK
jgi:hypothetical protein